MRTVYLLISLVLIIIMSACSSLTVKTDYDRGGNFKAFKTYRWAEGSEINPDDELVKNPLLQKRIISGIDKVLAEKGYSKVAGDNTDFIVLVYAGIKEKMQVTDWGNRGWYDPWWGPYGGRVDVSYYEEGTLVVDIVKSPEKDLAWRGLGTGIIKEVNPDDQEERIYSIVSQILKDFPPGK